MNINDITIIGHKKLDVKQFSYWVDFKTFKNIEGKKSRKDFLNFFESFLGPIGVSWHYMKIDHGTFTLKLNHESDLLFFLLKAKSS